MCIHKRKDWPRFHWNAAKLAEPLAPVRHCQGRLVGRMEALGFQLQQEAVLKTLTADVRCDEPAPGLHIRSLRCLVHRGHSPNCGANGPSTASKHRGTRGKDRGDTPGFFHCPFIPEVQSSAATSPPTHPRTPVTRKSPRLRLAKWNHLGGNTPVILRKPAWVSMPTIAICSRVAVNTRTRMHITPAG